MNRTLSKHLREEDIIPYLEACLAGAERERIETHLVSCEECRGELAELRSVMGLLDDWKAAEPSGSFDAVVREKITAEAERSFGWAWLGWRPAFGGALVVAVLIAGAVGLWRVSPPEMTDPPVVVTQPDPLESGWGALLAEDDESVTGDNQELIENFELLSQFDVLFEGGDT